MGKPAFCTCKNKGRDQMSADSEADKCLSYAKLKVQSLFFLNRTFQASNHLLLLYSPVCVENGQKPRRQVFLLLALIIMHT